MNVSDLTNSGTFTIAQSFTQAVGRFDHNDKKRKDSLKTRAALI